MSALASFLGLSRWGRHERAGFTLYGTAVAAAREPYLYTTIGVPDTLDGRFDLVGLHAFLLIRRLQRESGPGAAPDAALAQAVFDAMFSDMDINLRELGVGDMTVGKRVRAMWEAFHGRSAAYAAAMAETGQAPLAAALARNIWRGESPPEGAAETLARLVRAQDAYLADQQSGALARGEARFLPAEAACQ
jgi:cytochrome b pre-mRNA-processing protein 3